MPYKHIESRRHKFTKAQYEVTNWPEYNDPLRRSGDITICLPKRRCQRIKLAGKRLQLRFIHLDNADQDRPSDRISFALMIAAAISSVVTRLLMAWSRIRLYAAPSVI